MSTLIRENSRDVFLDVLKGLGCLLMIMAHMPFKISYYKYFTFLGGFAPIIFFAVAGITATFQAKTHPIRSVVFNYILLFLFGFALNGFHSPDFLRSFTIHFDMISTIALCSIVVYLLEFYLRPPIWIYIFLGFFSFAMKWGLAIILPVESYYFLAGVLLPHVGTFPLFPWLFLFFFGVVVYRINVLYNLLGAMLALGLYLMLDFAGFALDYRNKFDMSIGYFLLSCLMLFMLFSLVRKVTSLYKPSPNNVLVFLGRNSLLFLFLHFAVLRILSGRMQLEKEVQFFRHSPIFFWLFILAVTLLIMWISLHAVKLLCIDLLFHKAWVWSLVTMLVLTTPILLEHDSLIRWAEVILGILVGLNYQHLRHAFLEEKQSLSPSTSVET